MRQWTAFDGTVAHVFGSDARPFRISQMLYNSISTHLGGRRLAEGAAVCGEVIAQDLLREDERARHPRGLRVRKEKGSEWTVTE